MNAAHVTLSQDMEQGLAEETRRLKAIMERPHQRRIYGQLADVRPIFVESMIGDGRAIAILTPVQKRPHYFAIRIDSSWIVDGILSKDLVNDLTSQEAGAIRADGRDCDTRARYIEEIIIDEVGDCGGMDDEDEPEPGLGQADHRMWNSDIGFTWGIDGTPEGVIAETLETTA